MSLTNASRNYTLCDVAVHIGSVDVSGLTRDAAHDRLAEAYAGYGQGTVQVELAGKVTEIPYADIDRHADMLGAQPEDQRDVIGDGDVKRVGRTGGTGAWGWSGRHAGRPRVRERGRNVVRERRSVRGIVSLGERLAMVGGKLEGARHAATPSGAGPKTSGRI